MGRIISNIGAFIREFSTKYIAYFKSSNCFGKIILAIVPLIAACCICFSSIILFSPRTTAVPAPTLAQLAESGPVTEETVRQIEERPTEDVASIIPSATLPIATFTEQSQTPTQTPSATPEPTIAPSQTATPEPTNTPPPTAIPAPTITPLTSATPAPTNTPLPPTLTPTPEGPVNEVATVANVVDGDTIDVNIAGIVYQLRYIGIDSPERGQPFFDEAYQANSQLVSGQTVTLVKDVSETDQYGRLLRYVYLQDGTHVNAELVRLGFASAVTYPPDVAHSQTFSALEQEARLQGLGLWGLPAPTATLPPPPANTAPPPPAPTQPSSNCDPAYPDVCIPSPPPDLDCGDISYRRFRVIPPDPHRFDGDHDGIGCESG